MEAFIKIECWIGKLRPFAQGLPMLHFFYRPVAGCLLEFRIVGKYFAQITRIIMAIVFNHAGGLHQRKHLGLYLAVL